MKNKWKIIAPVGLVVFALICVFGGQALVDRVNAGKVDDPKAQQSQAAEETPDAATTDFSDIAAATPSPSVAPTAAPPVATPSDKPASESISVGDDGSITITPDFSNQTNNATKVVTPQAQVSANMSGGGGELPLDQDGSYHGDNKPTPAPDNTPTPAATPAPQDGSGGDSSSPSGGPPSYNGHNGEKNGNYTWVDGFGWIDESTLPDSGGTGGQIDDSDRYAPGTGLTGDKVGNM